MKLDDEIINVLTTIVTDISGCARCDSDGHKNLAFEPLTHPVELEDGTPPFTHWCACPTNRQPILLRDDPDG